MTERPESQKWSRGLHWLDLAVAIRMVRSRGLEIEYKPIYGRNGEFMLPVNLS